MGGCEGLSIHEYILSTSHNRESKPVDFEQQLCNDLDELESSGSVMELPSDFWKCVLPDFEVDHGNEPAINKASNPQAHSVHFTRLLTLMADDLLSEDHRFALTAPPLTSFMFSTNAITFEVALEETATYKLGSPLETRLGAKSTLSALKSTCFHQTMKGKLKLLPSSDIDGHVIIATSAESKPYEVERVTHDTVTGIQTSGDIEELSADFIIIAENMAISIPKTILRENLSV
ncbi:hypothetical protein BJ742DRAFT_737557 [Cladochytrium replicatum]|nr:hypothetical protein BJ742DRAFT_737557 [Cladochytrium replicatum]